MSDGMAVDCAGNLYLTTGGSSDGVITVWTRTAATGPTSSIPALADRTSKPFA
ncbi:MAG TPA: hypothetical protein VJN18_22980 [Polyangiaceae bacterium]|nr:hypothetical protein [Polyangiaceae bacterium]